ncbi:hypothetical protein [Botrimarina hoheduenensis]|uniref:Dockerin domain-containing protein n=1 Tax=Botrimarina hoheduenensis TaxID=2528000 RepID=A0A5C5WB09_9BACT|nr:hypothetical protein [Botrimarina hoheduenensis]TWT47697.1 hypothetical protein Pla111_13170 [Botrimarina hoheduenensis]
MPVRPFNCLSLLGLIVVSLISPCLQAQVVSVDLQRSGGVPVLDANGDWVWQVLLDTSPTSMSFAVEMGVTFSDATVISGSVTTTGIGNGGVESINPGLPVFGWEPLTGGFGGNFPEGLHVAPSEGTHGQAFYSFGTGILPGVQGFPLATFTTTGPTLSAPTSGIQVLGAYDSAGNISGAMPGTHGLLFASNGLFPFATSGTITAGAGDIDLDGFVGDLDASVLSLNFGTAASAGWASGDLDGNGQVDFEDVYAFSPNYQAVLSSATTEGTPGDGQVSVRYDPLTGEIALFPDTNDIGLVRLSSASGVFTGSAAVLPSGSFQTDTDTLIGVVTNTGGGSILSGGGISLGPIAAPGLDLSFLLQDLELNWSGGFGTPNQAADLIVASIGPGDFNGDGAVDNFDLNLLLLNWGLAATPTPAGWDGALPLGTVDNDELNQLLLNWGVGVNIAAIPEPAGLVLAVIALALAGRRR